MPLSILFNMLAESVDFQVDSRHIGGFREPYIVVKTLGLMSEYLIIKELIGVHFQPVKLDNCVRLLNSIPKIQTPNINTSRCFKNSIL
jgi:hypothetical protein